MGRILITANLHGYLGEFKALLKEANYDPNNDKLITLGNYLNYGNKQLELMDFLMELQKDGATILYGNYEKKYFDALVNLETPAEAYITRSLNVFYDYLENDELRKKHMLFLESLDEHIVIDNMIFSAEKQDVEGYQNFYCINDIQCKDDFVEEDNLFGVNFFNESIGLIDITNRIVYKTSIK